ncbi:MAG: hypothetical protein A6F72_07845 [Cycloclasticus sp. symbiont of Poecilosclerida sp. N]|nr:MAG: hypothetical protein A6F72_07845 [Cycloclasticus sp. symbiont of Poecilosclerida sp. N]
MVSNKTLHHPFGATTRGLRLSYLINSMQRTNDRLICRAGLLAMGQLMESLSAAERIEQYFPQPKSNCEYKTSEFLKILVLMQHEGGFHLDDIRRIDDADTL